MKALISVVIVVLMSGCASFGGINPEKVTYCERQSLGKGDWVFDIENYQAGMVSVPCFVLEGVKYYEVIYESDGKRHLVLSKHVAVLHQKQGGS